MREMKNSHIPFCDTIPENWNEMPNKYLFSEHASKVGSEHSKYQLLSLTKNGVKEKDINASGGKVPDSYDNYQTVTPGDMIFCLFDLDCSAVFSGLSNYNGMITSAYDVLKPNDKYIDAHFVDYWFQYVFSNRYYKMFSKNIRYTVTSEMFGSIYTPVPDISTQQKIGEMLDKKSAQIDTLIANQEAQIEKLKQYKQSLITEVVTKGLNPDVEMKDSGVEWIGEIPRHWKYLKSFYVYDKVGDIDHYMPPTVTEGYPYVMTGDLKKVTSEIDFTKCKQVSQCDYEQLSKKIAAQKGDVLFARYATIGTTCYVDIEKEFLVSYSCVVIKPKHSVVDGKYLWYYYQSLAFLEDIKKLINANTQANVGVDSLYRAKLVIPPCNEQQMMISYLDVQCAKIDKLIEIKQSKIAKLNEYKKSLIYEYVTGKKEVC